MAKFKHLTKEKFDNVCYRLFEIHSGLDGLGTLFESQSAETCFSTEELFGMGQVIKQLARNLSVQEDILRYGHDSRTVTKD